MAKIKNKKLKSKFKSSNDNSINDNLIVEDKKHAIQVKNKQYVNHDNYGQNDFLINHGTLIKYIGGNVNELIIPYGVSSIDEGAFSKNLCFRRIIFPSTLAKFNEDIFDNLTNVDEIQSVILPNAKVYFRKSKSIIYLNGYVHAYKNYIEYDKEIAKNYEKYIYEHGAKIVLNDKSSAELRNYIYEKHCIKLNECDEILEFFNKNDDIPKKNEILSYKRKILNESKQRELELKEERKFDAMLEGFSLQESQSLEEDHSLKRLSAKEEAASYLDSSDWQNFKFEEYDELYAVSGLANCKPITTLTIPSHYKAYDSYVKPVNKINDYAFSIYKNPDKANKLKEIACVFLNKNIVKIGEGAFEGLSNLRWVKDCDCIEEVGDRAFSGCKKLANREGLFILCNTIFVYENADPNVVLDNRVKTISSKVFDSRIETLKMSCSTTKIYPYAFEYCSNLRAITLSSNINEIAEGLFKNCASLKGINFDSSEVFEDKAIKKIGKYAFENCSSLERIVIPETVEEIEEGAFKACTNLKEVILPTNLRKIGKNAFEACNNLAKINFPSNLAYIKEAAFKDCSSLNNIELNEGIFELAANVFENCSSLENIKLAKSLEVIEKELFKNCISLKEMKLGSNINSILEHAFDGCLKLENIEIAENTLNISVGAFKDCKSLRSIKLPTRLKMLRDNLFEGCINLEEVAMPNDLRIAGNDVFKNCEKLEYLILANPKYSITLEKIIANIKDVDNLIVPNITIDQFRRDKTQLVNGYNYAIKHNIELKEEVKISYLNYLENINKLKN